MFSKEECQILSVIKMILDRHGCSIKEGTDLNNKVLDIECPEESYVPCAQELEEILG